MNIYDIEYIETLFDEMSATYEIVNLISSFGFSARWRRQFVQHVYLKSGMTICDLMCGMGECWVLLAPHLTPNGQLIGVDLSKGMLIGAEHRRSQFPNLNITLLKQNILANTLEAECADTIVCGFGIKTFNDQQCELFAAEIKRLLKPQGTFSLIEVSVPTNRFVKKLYMFYLKFVIPVIGRIFLGNPENYRMLGVYTEKFINSKKMLQALKKEGLQATYHQYFLGCASGVSGAKL